MRARKTNFSRPLARRSCVWAQGIPLWSSQGLFSLCGGREPSSCGVRLPRQMFRWTHTLPGVVIFQSLSLIFEVLTWCFRDSRALLRQHLHQAGWAWTEPVGCWVFLLFFMLPCFCSSHELSLLACVFYSCEFPPLMSFPLP